MIHAITSTRRGLPCQTRTHRAPRRRARLERYRRRRRRRRRIAHERRHPGRRGRLSPHRTHPPRRRVEAPRVAAGDGSRRRARFRQERRHQGAPRVRAQARAGRRRAHRGRRGAPRGGARRTAALGGAAPPSCTQSVPSSSQAPRPAPGAKSRSAGEERRDEKGEPRVKAHRRGLGRRRSRRNAIQTANSKPSLHFAKEFCDRDAFQCLMSVHALRNSSA